VDRYNNSIHSVTNRKPVDIFLNRTSRINYQGLNNFKEQTQEEIKGLLLHKKKMSTDRLNKHRNRTTQYNQGDTVYVYNRQRIKIDSNQRRWKLMVGSRSRLNQGKSSINPILKVKDRFAENVSQTLYKNKYRKKNKKMQ